jgi:hypothetical protein
MKVMVVGEAFDEVKERAPSVDEGVGYYCACQSVESGPASI